MKSGKEKKTPELDTLERRLVEAVTALSSAFQNGMESDVPEHAARVRAIELEIANYYKNAAKRGQKV
jgi:hypothetical protein